MTFLLCWIFALIGFCFGLFWAGCSRNDDESDLGGSE